jgi:hypothetical protein
MQTGGFPAIIEVLFVSGADWQEALSFNRPNICGCRKCRERRFDYGGMQELPLAADHKKRVCAWKVVVQM